MAGRTCGPPPHRKSSSNAKVHKVCFSERMMLLPETIASTVSGMIGVLYGSIHGASSNLKGQWSDQAAAGKLGA